LAAALFITNFIGDLHAWKIQSLANEASPWPELFDLLATRVFGLSPEYG
jgi:hypothetical protein